ncbi:MAG: hypothetical protein ACJAR1_002754 [Rubritalea sp.]|jgi:hypothetical protein
MKEWSRCLGSRAWMITLPMLLLTLCSCSDDPDASGKHAANSSVSVKETSHSRMLTLLADIAKQAKISHPILGEDNARELRRDWQNLSTSTRETPGPDTLKLLWQLGKAELKLGNIDAGIEHLTTARNGLKRLIADGKARPNSDLELTYQLGIAYMRKGETDNCCLRNSPHASCCSLRLVF